MVTQRTRDFYSLRALSECRWWCLLLPAFCLQRRPHRHQRSGRNAVLHRGASRRRSTRLTDSSQWRQRSTPTSTHMHIMFMHTHASRCNSLFVRCSSTALADACAQRHSHKHSRAYTHTHTRLVLRPLGFDSPPRALLLQVPPSDTTSTTSSRKAPAGKGRARRPHDR